MSRPGAELAEFVGGGDDAASEMMQPHAIDQHASHQRVATIGQPTGKRQPTTAGGNLGIIARDRKLDSIRSSHRQATRSHLLPGLTMVTAVEQECPGLPAGLADIFGQGPDEFFDRDLRLDLGDLRCVRLDLVSPLLVVLVEVPAGDIEVRVLFQQRLLLVSLLVAGRCLGLSHFATQRLVVAGVFLLERLLDVLLLLGVLFLVDHVDLFLDPGANRFLDVGVQRHASLTGIPPRLPVIPRFEDSTNPVVVDL